VESVSAFYQGVGSDDNQEDIDAPVLTFPGHSVALNHRVGGADRYGTAAKAALSAAGCFTATCPTGIGPRLQSVVLASGENFPDALSGNFLATSQGTVILLTRAGSLPQVTEDAICELGVQRVFIVGGTAAVSSAVENHLKSIQQHNQGCNGILGTGNTFLAVTRLAGADRYKTNKAVNEYAAANNLNATSVGLTNITFGVPAKRTALVATGENFPDALAAGPATVRGNFPIILTPTAALGGDAAAQLNDLGIEQSVIVGGESAVSSAAAGAIPGAVKRIAGADRYETATKLADFEVTPFIATSTREGGLGFDPGTGDDEVAFLATGQAFADALAGGPLAGQIGNGSPILLTTPSPLSAATQTWLAAHQDTYIEVQALGLAQAVSDAALTAANQAIS
jgi:putative cell wall-binding protein